MSEARTVGPATRIDIDNDYVAVNEYFHEQGWSDGLPVMPPTADEVAQRVPELVRILRASRPNTPILLVEDRTYSDAFLHQDRAERNRSSRAALRQAYGALKDVNELHYMAGEQLLGADGDDTVDGSHPTDLGFKRHAEAFYPILHKLLTA